MEDKHICTLVFKDDSIRRRRTRRQKILEYLSNSVLVSEKNPRALLYFRSPKEIEAERIRQRNSKDKVIHPFSEFRIYLELAMIVLFLTHLMTTCWDMFTDAIYASKPGVLMHMHLIFAFITNLTDIIITFHTGYEIQEKRIVVIDKKEIRRRYSRSFIFISDVIATIPLELIICYLPYTHAHRVRWLSLSSVTRLFRLPTTIIYLGNAADLWKVSPVLYRITRYIIFSVLILHWTTCMSIVGSKFFYMYNLDRTLQNWIGSAEINEETNRFKAYVTGLLRTTAQLMGISHGIYPNITIEDKLFTALTFMAGYFLMGFLLVLALQIITSQSVPELTNMAFLNQLEIYMSRIKLPKNKQKSLINYYKYLFSESSFYDDETIKMLSEQLQTEITKHNYRSVVRNASILAYFPMASIDSMLNYLVREIYMPGEYIMKAGASGNCMYFIVKGTIAITTFYGIEVCHLHDGAYFGEIALIVPENKRTTNAIALEISEICRLSRKYFDLCISHETPAYKDLVTLALSRQEHMEELDQIHRNRLYHRNFSLFPIPKTNTDDFEMIIDHEDDDSRMERFH